MTDVFISYCSADRDRAAQLAHAFEKEKLSVWWDRSLIAGTAYDTEIDKALSEAKAVVVVWSQAAVVSEWVRSEAEEARGENKLVPVRIEECRPPLSARRLHTIDLSQWKGERSHEYLSVLEAVKARVEGRVARPSRFVRRLTISSVAAGAIASLALLANLMGVVDLAIRWTTGGAAFAASESGRFAGESVSPETQEGFRSALAELARSADLRTQRALTMLERSDSRTEAVLALESLASDQGAAIDDQMSRTARLWRQIGLLRFNENVGAARDALERARRYDPDDPTTLTALGALYHREGRVADADEVYRIVLSRGMLDASTEGQARQAVGQAHFDRGEYDAAHREFAHAFALARQSVDERLEADLYLDFGVFEQARGNLAAARAHFNDARELALAIDYGESAVYADYNLAELQVSERQYDEAERSLRAVREAAEAYSDSFLPLFVDLSLAKIAAGRGEFERALGIAENVRRRAVEVGARRAELAAILDVAESQIHLRRYRDAEQSAANAAEGYRALRSTSALSIASAMRDVAASHDPARRQQACASLNALVTHGVTQREIAQLRRLSTCAA